MRQAKQITISHGALSISNQNFRKFGNSGNGTEISRKRFQKFWKVLNFRNANHSTENSGSKVEWKENFWENMFENLGIPREVFLFLEILENAVPFATGSCQKFKPEVLVEWKAPTMYMYPWLFCTMANCKGPINSHQCNLTL